MAGLRISGKRYFRKIVHELSGGIAEGKLLLVHDGEQSFGECGFQLDGKQLFQLLGHSEIRDKGDAKADTGQIQKQVIGA